MMEELSQKEQHLKNKMVFTSSAQDKQQQRHMSYFFTLPTDMDSKVMKNLQQQHRKKI
jgi:hypothetical protein